MTFSPPFQKGVRKNKKGLILFSAAPLIPASPMVVLLSMAILRNKEKFLNFVSEGKFYVMGLMIYIIGLILGVIMGALAFDAKTTSKEPSQSDGFKKYLAKDVFPKMLSISIVTIALSLLGLALFPLALKYNTASKILNAVTILGVIAFIGFIGLLIYSIVDLIRFDKKYKVALELQEYPINLKLLSVNWGAQTYQNEAVNQMHGGTFSIKESNIGPVIPTITLALDDSLKNLDGEHSLLSGGVNSSITGAVKTWNIAQDAIFQKNDKSAALVFTEFGVIPFPTNVMDQLQSMQEKAQAIVESIRDRAGVSQNITPSSTHAFKRSSSLSNLSINLDG